jgi:hypothetical protein
VFFKDRLYLLVVAGGDAARHASKTSHHEEICFFVARGSEHLFPEAVVPGRR